MSNNSAPEAVCRTVMLVDEVASDDAFQHRSVAHAIASMILDGEKGGCAIALTGNWGSGKSSVVRFMADELTAAKKGISTFVFDAWAHQGDPLRRTFLEKIIDWCDGELGWTKRETDWLAIKEQLAKRREEIRTTSTPHLTVWGVVGALSILIAPVGLACFQKIHYDIHPRLFLATLAVSAAPVIIGMLMLIWWGASEWRKDKKERKPIPSLIYNSMENHVVSKTSKTPDPTSVEFEDCYRKLLSECLRTEDRQLVIVVDNLDRVSKDDARAIWASLRVFFDSSSKANEKWRRRVWVVVPFDPDAISDLWASASGSVLDNTDSTASMGVSTNKSLGGHFLEKTFQTTFRVPPIVFSNWEEYLLKRLREAFPNSRHTDDEFHTIFRLYDRLSFNGPKSPTPRNLKIFVNGLGALHRQWQDHIPLTHQAAFTLLADRSSEEILGILRSGQNLMRPSIPYILEVLLGDVWRKNLAALYFNVDAQVAYQVLLSQPIQKALQSNDHEALEDLSKNPGFQDVIESVVETTFLDSPSEPDILANAAIALGKVSHGWGSAERCAAHLYRAFLSLQDLKPFDDRVAKGIAELIRIQSGVVDVGSIVVKIRDSLRTGNSIPALQSIGQWSKGIRTLLPILVARDSNSVRAQFSVLGDAPDYLNVIAGVRAGGLDSFEWSCLVPEAPKDEIIEYLGNVAAQGNWSDDVTDNVATLRQVAEDWDWQPLFRGLESRITDHPHPLPSDIPSLLKFCFSLGHGWPETAREILQNPEKNEALLQILFSSNQAGHNESVALCMLPLLSGNSQFQGPYPGYGANTPQWRFVNGKQVIQGYIQSPPLGSELMSSLSSNCLTWLSPKEWREVTERRPECKQLVASFLGTRVSEVAPENIDAAELVNNGAFWREVAGDPTYDLLIAAKASSGELSSFLMTDSFRSDWRHLSLVALKAEQNETFKQFLVESLTAFEKGDWLRAFSLENESVEIALMLRDSGFTSGVAFEDAMYDDFDRLISGSGPENREIVWQDLTTLLPDEEQSVFKSRLLSRFKIPNGELTSALAQYGEPLSDAVIEAGIEDCYERIKQIIETHDKQVVLWLANVLSKTSAKTKRATSIRRSLKDRAESFLDESIPDEERGALRVLISELEI